MKLVFVAFLAATLVTLASSAAVSCNKFDIQSIKTLANQSINQNIDKSIDQLKANQSKPNYSDSIKS